uniref:Helicase/UvrB N-terminal domain-containing protein n=1 Tax=viral metagenome TaxID=1070528 RepID=A0A6C0IRG0_9ZZZZ
MDLKQRKLSKSEWESIEIPVSSSELDVLKLIIDGYHNVNIKINNSQSIFTHLKIEYSSQIEEYMYSKYFANDVRSIVEKYNINFIEFETKKSKKNTNNINDNTNVNTLIYKVDVCEIVRLNSVDQVRIAKFDTLDISKVELFDIVLFNHLKKMVKAKYENNSVWLYHYYTLSKLINYSVSHVNRIVTSIIQCFLSNIERENIQLLEVVKKSQEYIERNQDLLRYSDMHLYEHQKDIFTCLKRMSGNNNGSNSKKDLYRSISIDHSQSNISKANLILYIAPTGTGKTLTPLGLSEKYKVIFVCAARHVGLALARSAISINKKIAFAFGCSSAQDVRLHYFAAKDYTTDRRSGRIRKVDNTVGDKVEIIICDIRSYLPAMYYMLAFNNTNDIVTYWDEPTISLDYNSHELHKIIKKNWSENIIPNMVLSSATLPKENELQMTIADFQEKFKNATIHNIVSHDCKKTIPLINNNGFIIMPHYLSDNYDEILSIVENCENNMSLLRYFDLNETAKFIYYIEESGLSSSKAKFDRQFASINDIDMKNIKMFYLKVLKSISKDKWVQIYNHFIQVRNKVLHSNNTIDSKGNAIISKINSVGPGVNVTTNVNEGKPLTRLVSEQIINTNNNSEPSGSSGVYVTTKDAYTLTDGPTIFIAGDLQKIAKFCIQQSNIPASVMKSVYDSIEFNNQLNEKIAEIEETLETEEKKLLGPNSSNNTNSKTKSGSKKDDAKKANKLIDKSNDANLTKLREQREILRGMVKRTSIDDIFIPNKLPHLQKWSTGLFTNKAFTSNIDEDIVSSIMLLNDVDDSWKVLLLLGIGVFTEHKSSSYTEIMKKLADTQRLYLIIADSDYIYGTNYQFCHGYLSKDLVLTQEKIIQALGRIGRNNIQQEYSARFRDDSQIKILFKKFASQEKPEVINMNCLFNSKNIVWNGTDYEEQEEDDEDELEEQQQEQEEEYKNMIEEEDDDEEDYVIVE